MGFYAPAQIVRDAQEHGVEVRPVDINFSFWDCTLEPGSEACLGVPSPLVAGGTREGGYFGDSPHCFDNSELPDRAPEQTLRGARSLNTAIVATPLPNPPPQGGREPSCACGDNLPNAIAPAHKSAKLHPRHAEMKNDIRATHAVRSRFPADQLFFRRRRPLRSRTSAGAGFDSIRDLWLRTGLAPSVLERLAEADAFRSLGLDRRDALWAVAGLAAFGRHG